MYGEKFHFFWVEKTSVKSYGQWSMLGLIEKMWPRWRFEAQMEQASEELFSHWIVREKLWNRIEYR